LDDLVLVYFRKYKGKLQIQLCHCSRPHLNKVLRRHSRNRSSSLRKKVNAKNF